MKFILKENLGLIVKQLFIFDPISLFQQIKQFLIWTNDKTKSPPHIIKQLVIMFYAKKYQLNIFIETGTFLGHMVDAMKNNFCNIYSIELSEKLYKKAKKKFAASKHINIFHGNSGEILSHLLKDIKEPCLFWLDGHYSAGITAKGETETPILQELNHILNHPILNHVILIDDARCFGKEKDYPTLAYIKEFITTRNRTYKIEIADDIIQIYN